ncbi:hypothetical protein B7494_g4346 [Chlorociboria aeruginascens]|nr:hypothetical protein B7494_g4346 [Chlorociboria aeruginascens]
MYGIPSTDSRSPPIPPICPKRKFAHIDEPDPSPPPGTMERFQIETEEAQQEIKAFQYSLISRKQCKSKKIRLLQINAAAFSVAMNATEARVYISWKHNKLRYYMQKVRGFALKIPEDYVAFRKYVRNILDWRKHERLEEVRKSIDCLLEETRKTASKSRLQPSSTSSNQSDGGNARPPTSFQGYNQGRPFMQFADNVEVPKESIFDKIPMIVQDRDNRAKTVRKRLQPLNPGKGQIREEVPYPNLYGLLAIKTRKNLEISSLEIDLLRISSLNGRRKPQLSCTYSTPHLNLDRIAGIGLQSACATPEGLPIGLLRAVDMDHEDNSSGNKSRKQPGNVKGTGGGKQGQRKRVSQACHKCRNRKDRCDGKRPTCSTCITHGRECTYDASVKKRGLPEGYVRGMEKLWGLTIREVDGIEKNILSVFTGDEKSDGLRQSWSDDADNLVDIWRKSQISRQLERLLPILESTSESMKRKRPSSDTTFEKRIARGQNIEERLLVGWRDKKFDCHGPDVANRTRYNPGIGHIDPILSRGYESILKPASRNLGILTPAIDIPDLPSETWHLLDVYFSYTHCWLPIIEKHDLLRISHQYPDNKGETQSATGDQAVLWAVIAYAKYQHRAINNTPHAQGPVSEMVWTAERMYSQARRLIPDEEGILDVSHAQALLILALVNMGIGHLSRAWLLVGQAVRVAIDLGIDKVSFEDEIKYKTKSRSKHVFLGCFILDTIIAARLGRRPHLRSDDIEQVGSVDENGLDEWDPWTDCLSVRKGNTSNSRGPASILSTFNKLVQVLRILNEIISLPSNSEGQYLRADFSNRLHIWSLSQSPPLSLGDVDSRNDNSLLLPHHYHLQISFLNTLATSQLLPNGNGKGNLNLEPCNGIARQIVGQLMQHSQSFGLVMVSPIFEYYMKSTYGVLETLQDSIENTHVILNDCRHGMDNCLLSMESAWPTFELLKISPLCQPKSRTRQESQVAFDLTSTMNPCASTPRAVMTPNSSTTFEINSPFTPQLFRSHSMTSSERAPQARSAVQPKSPMAPPSLHPNHQSIYSSTNLALDFQDSPTAIFSMTDPVTSNSWPSITNQPEMQNPRTVNNEIDADSTFNEFAALDAMEWSEKWDQSLVNLGFTNSDNMNQDFYAFCREPDPLSPNNVFQQLLATSNAATAGLLDGSAFSGLGTGGLGGKELLELGDENEGIEAGQILQALSAAEG